MKTRQGFVSNSSTSSFCIYGVDIGGNIPENALEIIKNSEGAKEKLDKKIADYSSRKNNSEYGEQILKVCVALRNLDDPNVFAEDKKRGCEHDIVPDLPDAKFCPVCGKEIWITIINDLKEVVMEYLNDESGDEFYALLGLEAHGSEYSSYVGRSWSSIGLDETGREFMASVDKVVKLLGKDKKGTTIAESWYNG
jgi:hypothetical protein